jgi:putative SOS response-associated peptidase YedK
MLPCMCGRFRLARKKEILEAEFDACEIPDEPGWEPRYNIAPTQEVATVRQDPIRPERHRRVIAQPQRDLHRGRKIHPDQR